MSRNKEAPLCSLFLLIYFLYYEYLWVFPKDSLYISYFKYFPSIFPCMIRNGLCLLRPGEPSAGSWGNPNRRRTVQRLKKLYKNPLGKPSQGKN